MKKIDIKAFEVFDEYDSGSRHHCYVSNEALAVQITRDNPYMSYKEITKTIKVIETIDEYNSAEREKKIDKIRLKLTKEELEFLGI